MPTDTADDSEQINPAEIAGLALLFAKADGDDAAAQQILAAAKSDGGQAFSDAFGGTTAGSSEAAFAAIPTAHLLADPSRFQFRTDAFGQPDYREPSEEKFDPAKCLPLSVWRDPASELDYVVDGHERHARAVRDGAVELPARWIEAKDADEAREIGRQANFTPWDRGGPASEQLLRAEKRVRDAEAEAYHRPSPHVDNALREAREDLERVKRSERLKAKRPKDFAEDAKAFAEDAQGHEHAEKGKKGGQFVKKGTDGGDDAGKEKGKERQPSRPPRTQPDPLPERFKKSATGRTLIDASVQRWAEGTNEPAVAKAVGGKSLPDNEPMDVLIPPEGKAKHGIELKTMVDNRHGQIHMNSEAKARKKAWRRKNKVPVHTVVIDDRAVYNANGPGQHDLSKRKVYYRRGFGSFKVEGMHEVEGGFEGLKNLLDMPTRSLPPGAWKPKPLEVRRHAGIPTTMPGLNKPVAEEHVAVAKKWVGESPHLTPAVRDLYARTMAQCLANVPEKSRAKAIEAVNAGSATFHPDRDSIKAAIEKITKKPEKGTVTGFVAHRKGDDRAYLNVDGGTDVAGSGFDKLDAVSLGRMGSTYHHELGHCVDVGGRYSSGKGWQSAWERDIRNGKTLLSHYGRTSAEEGFAEFHRALCEVPTETLRAKFPKCVKFFEAEGLL